MKTIYELQETARRLRNVTETGAITPDDVFGLGAETLEYLADMEQSADGLGIRKVYASYADMTADTTPTGSNGKALRFGQLVTVYTAGSSQAENGNIYAWQKGNTASPWLLVGNMDVLLQQITAVRQDLTAEVSRAQAAEQQRLLVKNLGQFDTEEEADVFTTAFFVCLIPCVMTYAVQGIVYTIVQVADSVGARQTLFAGENRYARTVTVNWTTQTTMATAWQRLGIVTYDEQQFLSQLTASPNASDAKAGLMTSSHFMLLTRLGKNIVCLGDVKRSATAEALAATPDYAGNPDVLFMYYHVTSGRAPGWGYIEQHISDSSTTQHLYWAGGLFFRKITFTDDTRSTVAENGITAWAEMGDVLLTERQFLTGLKGLYGTPDSLHSAVEAALEIADGNRTSISNLVRKLNAYTLKLPLPFDGIITDTIDPEITESAANPDAILFSTALNAFVAKTDDVYYSDWQESGYYNESSTGKAFFCSGMLYLRTATGLELIGSVLTLCATHITYLGEFTSSGLAETAARAVEIAGNPDILFMYYHATAGRAPGWGYIEQKVRNSLTTQILYWNGSKFRRDITFTDATRSTISTSTSWQQIWDITKADWDALVARVAALEGT